MKKKKVPIGHHCGVLALAESDFKTILKKVICFAEVTMQSVVVLLKKDN